jgi:hypothetical protein
MSYFSDVNKIAEQMCRMSFVRVGEAYYNALYQYDPEQANRVEGSTLDPFYHKENLGAFLEMLRNKGDSLTIQT